MYFTYTNCADVLGLFGHVVGQAVKSVMQQIAVQIDDFRVLRFDHRFMHQGVVIACVLRAVHPQHAVGVPAAVADEFAKCPAVTVEFKDDVLLVAVLM